MYTVSNDPVFYVITKDNDAGYNICTQGIYNVYNHYNVPDTNLFSVMATISFTLNNVDNKGCAFEVEL